MKTIKPMISWFAAATMFSAPSLALAQASPPSPCNETEGSICQTLDYGHAQTAEEYYWFFESEQAVEDFIVEKLTGPALLSAAGPGATFREVTHDPALVEMVSEIFDGFKAVFPNEMTGLTEPPPVVIIESERVNAYAFAPTEIGIGAEARRAAPWLFVIQTGLLDHDAGENGLRGVVAHELGHLLLRNGFPEVLDNVRRTYLVSGSEDGILGAAQDNDPALAEHADRIRHLQERVGILPELGQSVLGLTSTYEQIITSMLNDAPAGCPSADPVMSELRTLQISLLPNASTGDLTPSEPSPEQASELDRLNDALISALDMCDLALYEEVAGEQVKVTTLAQVAALIAGLPLDAADPQSPRYDEVRALMFEAEQMADDTMPDASLQLRLLTAAKAMRAEAVALRSDPRYPIEQVRVYDREEDADDASIRVLHWLGYDPLGISDFLLSLSSDEAEEACRADLAAGVPISAGGLRDAHPPNCWRAYHAEQFVAALDQCSDEPEERKRHHKRWWWGRSSGKRSAPVHYDWSRARKLFER